MMQTLDKPLDFFSDQDLTKELNKLQIELSIPKTEKELAQVYAYESFLSSSPFEKVDLANKAWDLDPQNPDGLLLRAGLVKDLQEQRDYMEQAIRISEQQLDLSMDNPCANVLNHPYMCAIFVYGISYFEEGNYDEALKLFGKLLQKNKADNQGVRYLAMVCYLALGSLDKVET